MRVGQKRALSILYSLVRNQVKYERVQDALDLIKPESFMTKIDINAAYRAVAIDPSQYYMCSCVFQNGRNIRETVIIL